MKREIILVNPSLSYDGKVHVGHVYPATAIMIFAAILKKAGYSVKIIDGNLFNISGTTASILSAVNKDTLFVGFSFMSSQTSWVWCVAKSIKEIHHKLKIVLGGPHPTIFPEQAIKEDFVDIVAINEFAGSIVALANALNGHASLDFVPGIIFKDNGTIVKTKSYIEDDISQIPFIDFSLLNHTHYSTNNVVTHGYSLPVKAPRVYPILTGLGCAYKCSFCVNSILARRYRYRQAVEIVERIEFLIKEYGADFIMFMDEDFFINKERIYKFLDLVERKKLHFFWRPWLRVDHFNKDYINADLAERLEKNGMLFAVMGAESGSQNILNDISKGIKLEQTINAAEILKNTNIIPRFSFMVGLPGETESDIRATYRFAIKLRKINPLVDTPVMTFRLYPGSHLYERAKVQYGYKEPQSFLEWSGVDFSKGYGYLDYNQYQWIPNKRKFRVMRFCYDRFFNPVGRLNLLKLFLRELTIFRFESRLFGFTNLEGNIIYFLVSLKAAIRKIINKLKPSLCRTIH